MRRFTIVYVLLAVLLLSGCAMRTVEDMYTPPRRSAEYEDLQRAIDDAMEGLSYAAPLSGEYRQSVQMADLNGDGRDEYLLFAKDTSDKPLKIMIFTRDADGCRLTETLENRGAAFDMVNYVDLDGEGGLELVVGRQISNVILRSVSVYSFRDDRANRIHYGNYSKIVPTDLNSDGISELMIITRGESDVDNAVASLYSYEDGAMVRSREADLSEGSDRIKRIMVGKLHRDVPAVYVASNVDDHAIITDIFALKYGKFTNVSFSNESGTSVQTLRNHFVYADDIDSDGVLELPDLIDMVPVENTAEASNQRLIRWYAMDISGREVDKMYTFHNFDSGWYLQLDEELAGRISVIRHDGSSIFYLWDRHFESAQLLMTVRGLTGADREMAERADNYVLCRTEGVTYTVKTEDLAEQLGFTPQLLAERFHLIQMDWKNGET